VELEIVNTQSQIHRRLVASILINRQSKISYLYLYFLSWLYQILSSVGTHRQPAP